MVALLATAGITLLPAPQPAKNRSSRANKRNMPTPQRTWVRTSICTRRSCVVWSNIFTPFLRNLCFFQLAMTCAGAGPESQVQHALCIETCAGHDPAIQQFQQFEQRAAPANGTSPLLIG